MVGGLYGMEGEKGWGGVKEGQDLVVKGRGKKGSEMVEGMEE